MKKIISKEVVYDKETPIDLVKNALDCLSTINGAIRTIIYKITYKKRRLFSKKETIEIDYKIEQWIPEIHSDFPFMNHSRSKGEDYLYELVRKSKFDAEVQINKLKFSSND
jgi:hypothetical protein